MILARGSLIHKLIQSKYGCALSVLGVGLCCPPHPCGLVSEENTLQLRSARLASGPGPAAGFAIGPGTHKPLSSLTMDFL